ncbi:hypothetical protein EVAR_86053_1 [Eumeta japonica]|uniref:Uncharacterized protein n=1 Tax=Eumeta variegata TaxID=151549 RepID=A0A4C1UK65_EUMVA|nr:hypothetical protein EVAR_86053_1 [Eumeta japonica]
MDELSVKCLLDADAQVILAPSTCKLQEMAIKIYDSVKKRALKLIKNCENKSGRRARRPRGRILVSSLRLFIGCLRPGGASHR